MEKLKLIESREDVKRLVETFYAKVLKDETIGFIFTEVAKIEPETHFPKITDFWESVLFNTAGYTRNVMQIHLDLNAEVKLEAAHFQRWLELWQETVNEMFTGELAERANQRALSIATIMQMKLKS